MNRIWVFGGGTIDIDFVSDYMRRNEEGSSLIIAADKGLEAVSKLSLNPDIILGDFDSVDRNLYERYVEKEGISIISFPPEKDYTDMELAVTEALKGRPSEICIFGGTGTRLDHVIGNIFCLEAAVHQLIPAKIIDKNNCIQLFGAGEYILKSSDMMGAYLSFLPYTDRCVVSLDGFLYPIENYELKKGTTLGISNEAASEILRVRVSDGILIFIQSRD